MYIYGPTGSFKTTAARLLAKVDYFEFNEQSEQFPLSGYSGQRYIIWDEMSEGIFDKFRNTLLRIVDSACFTVSQKGKNITTHGSIEKFIVTSNYEPPDDDAFKRRFEIKYLD